MKKAFFLFIFPIIAFGQTELDSIEKLRVADSIIQAITMKMDSSFKLLNKKIELKNIAEEKFNNGDYYGAISDYTKIIELDPDDNYVYEDYYNRAVVKSKLGDNYGAISDYTNAAEINPDYYDAYVNLSINKSLINDHLGAIIDICKAIELDPKNAKGYKIRGLAFMGFQGKPIKSQKCSDFRKSCDLGDENACKYYSEYCP
jgi:tetratricopeptide (TPR) repeat protein